jgi:hypothetical protein
MKRLNRIALGLGALIALAAPATASAALSTPLPDTAPIPAPSSSVLTQGLMSPMAAIIGNREVCVVDTWVRESDLSHVKGVLYKGDIMTVDRYADGSGNTWAVGTAHTQAGDKYGYVLYNSHTFKNTNGNCV